MVSHPDKNPDPESKKLFVKIANAYEVKKSIFAQFCLFLLIILFCLIFYLILGNADFKR
jgi:predicted permease